jgi:hypothetical protein
MRLLKDFETASIPEHSSFTTSLLDLFSAATAAPYPFISVFYGSMIAFASWNQAKTSTGCKTRQLSVWN